MDGARTASAYPACLQGRQIMSIVFVTLLRDLDIGETQFPAGLDMAMPGDVAKVLEAEGVLRASPLDDMPAIFIWQYAREKYRGTGYRGEGIGV